MSHTKEPWSIHPKAPEFIRANDGKKHIGNTESLGDAETNKANARRIVACVNACKGFMDPEKDIRDLESGCSKHYNQAMLNGQRASLAESQRDELLAALERGIKYIDATDRAWFEENGRTGETYVEDEELITLRAAIASVKSAKCETCNGRGEIGGHVGQTPESFDYVTEPCPDCLKGGA